MKKAYTFLMPIGIIGLKSMEQPPFELDSLFAVTVFADDEPTDVLPLEESKANAYTFICPAAVVGLTKESKDLFALDKPFGVTVFSQTEPLVDDVPEPEEANEQEPKLQKAETPIDSGEFVIPASEDVLEILSNSENGMTPERLRTLMDKLHTFIEEHDSDTLFDSVCDGVNKILICKPVECILYAAACLADDDLDADEYESLGYCSYPGDNKLYDVSWFEEELDEKLKDIYNLEDVRDVTVEWINYNYREFEELVDLLRELRVSPEGVWQWAQRC